VNQHAHDFQAVYEDHVWRVYGFLAYHLPEPGPAEDLTQTTFERALRAWSRFDPRRASEATWLLAIARNALIDHYRRGRRETDLPSEGQAQEAMGSVPGPEAHWEGWPELLEALDDLSEREREVIALRYGGDLTGQEIASLLDLSLPNVQQILSRSLRKLRTLLSAEGSVHPGVA
jgi:RNA polymerase sigma factor (sigma-70 family)